jgi:hypothetical protein
MVTCNESRLGDSGLGTGDGERVAHPHDAETNSAAQTSRMWRKLAASNRLGHLTL